MWNPVNWFKTDEKKGKSSRMYERDHLQGGNNDMVQTDEMRVRSMLAAEFGILNKGKSLSCFMNVALQTLWVFPAVRMQLRAFCD